MGTKAPMFDALPYTLLLSSFYAASIVAARFGIEQFTPVSFVGFRLVIATAFLLVVYLLSRERKWPFRRRALKHALLAGAAGTAIPQLAVVSSLQFQSAGVTSLLTTTAPAITVLLAHFLLQDERLNVRKVLGVLLALVGVVLLLLRGVTGRADIEQLSIVGYGLVLVGMVCKSGAGIYIRSQMIHYDSLDVASLQVGTAALVTIPWTVAEVAQHEHHIDGTGIIALLIAALLGMAGGYLLSAFIVQRFSATAWSVAFYLTPAVSALAGVILLDEEVGWEMIAGMLIIIAGTVLINRRDRTMAVTAPE